MKPTKVCKRLQDRIGKLAAIILANPSYEQLTDVLSVEDSKVNDEADEGLQRFLKVGQSSSFLYVFIYYECR